LNFIYFKFEYEFEETKINVLNSSFEICERNKTEAGLHYGDYRSKLLHFEEQKKHFLWLKKI